MNKEQVNMAIAESLGWTNVSLYEDSAGPSYWSGLPAGKLVSVNGEWDFKREHYSRPIPNYYDSLDACAEFEESLTEDCNLASGRVRYNNILMSICGSHAKCISAKSSQRSEAYLKLKGRWVES